MAAIELRRVSRRHGAGRPALDAVDLAIADGERLAVLGPSGSGKTTLLRLIAGLDRPTEGGVWFDGACIDGVPPHRRDVGMVFQEPALHPFLDVAGNLEFGLRARGVARAERRRRTGEVAAMLGLDGLLTRRPYTLSGGERQRVALGRAVVRRPAILLLDEPFSSLDLPLRAGLRRELIDLHDRLGMTLVHVTHDQAEALALGRRIAVLDRGRLVQTGTPRDVYDRPASAFVAGFVGSPPMNLIPCEIEVDAASGDARAVVASHQPVRLPEALARSIGLNRGERRNASWGIRPEHVQIKGLDEEPPGESGRVWFDAVVRRVEYQGEAVLVTLDLAGTAVVARLAESARVDEGGKMRLVFDLAKSSWFPA
ncbi:ABC transporter ATP-binding protein [Paludisphaera mucosa]|uniref:ABC transporter ATP-binding protein n=1 Tax=Paludisphaera mucosa TaxID=3030827 RepID=A0ABT6F5N0_9BACT|nr:ABC transporter ATP-binding protein [Paludisphaera mucosa]MDG3002886.1 ABC transporter ATP-binding protein [Paludisphaera mucosa]